MKRRRRKEENRRGLGDVVGWVVEGVDEWECRVMEETGRSEEEKEYGVDCVEEEERQSRRRRH